MSEEAPNAAAPLVRQGLEEAAAIPHPLLRARHRSAWIFRLSAVDPEAAAALDAELEVDPVQRAQLLLTVTADRLHRRESLEPHFSRTLELSEGLDPDTRLRVLNSLSELAIELADRDRAAGLELLGTLVPAAHALVVPDAEHQHFQVLACALLGEGLLVLDDPRGPELLDEAERLAADLPGREPVVVFLAGARARRDPRRALALVETLEESGARLEAGMQVLPSLTEAADRKQLLEAILPAVRHVAHWQGPETLVMLAQAVAQAEPELSRPLFEEALAGSPGNPPQVRALQSTGVAKAVAAFDRDWSERLFREAAETAGEEDEPVKRVTTLALIANEMAEPFPREAAEIFQRALAESEALTAVWEFAHVLDIVFRPDRSPFLDIKPAQAILERMMGLLSDEDPRVPGVMNVADVAQAMREVDPARATELYWRWFQAAESGDDSDGMTAAAQALSELDPEAGREALRKAHEYLIRRVDCPAMGEFCRRAAAISPDLVLSMAPNIPDARERSDAFTEAAVGLYKSEPERALELIRGLQRPVDRSSALLRIVDDLLGTPNRPQPQPLLEDMP